MVSSVVVASCGLPTARSQEVAPRSVVSKPGAVTRSVYGVPAPTVH
ncbi:hypothetical protein [Micromonospora aurantiaca]